MLLFEKRTYQHIAIGASLLLFASSLFQWARSELSLAQEYDQRVTQEQDSLSKVRRSLKQYNNVANSLDWRINDNTRIEEVSQSLELTRDEVRKLDTVFAEVNEKNSIFILESLSIGVNNNEKGKESSLNVDIKGRKTIIYAEP